MLPPSASVAVGIAYILVGLAGLVLNLVTVLMILTRRVYRLSAYSIMANVALADAVMMAVTGVFCGAAILMKTVDESSGVVVGAPIDAHNGTRTAWSQRDALVEGGVLRGAEELTRFGWHNSDDGRLESGVGRVRRRGGEFADDGERRHSLGHAKWCVHNLRRHHHLTRRRAIRNAPPTRPPPPTSPPRPQSRHWLPHWLWALREHEWLALVPSVVETSAWTAGVLSYAVLGLNRCVAICFYSTKAKTFNRVSIASGMSVACWLLAFALAALGTFPSPLVGLRLDMWSTSLLPPMPTTYAASTAASGRLMVFISISMVVHFISAATQWTCSTLVLLKIRQVKRKILKNQLNQSSANRFRKQARLTFQFFYPSLFCTLTSLLYFVKPLVWQRLGDAYLIALHMVWLANHLCNPFIYAYFNERMRATYREMLTCSRLRTWMSRTGKWRFGGQLDMRHPSSRYAQASRRSARFSLKSGTRPSNGNFVRSSLQMQSRDFEQLCEFMMRVNPLNMSSEGWRESSEWLPTTAAAAEESAPKGKGGSKRLLGTKSGALSGAESHRSSFRSIVVDLGLPTVEGLARFAKKTSI